MGSGVAAYSWRDGRESCKVGCWEEIDVASASAISARWRTEGFVEFTMERNAAVTAFSCAYVYNQMVEEFLSLY